MRLMIVRHGDPDYSIDSLTPTGWKEAEILSDRLSKLEVKAFYCSPLGRAKDTAKATLQKMGREAEICPWLREFSPHVSKPCGQNGTVCWDWLPGDWTKEPRYYDKEHWLSPEPMEQAQVRQEYRRVTEEFDRLLAKHGYVRDGNCYRVERANRDTLVLFCHFGVECVLLGHLLGVSPMILWHGMCAAPTSVTTVYTEERRKGTAYFRVSAFGDVSHLYAAGEAPSFAARFCETYDDPSERHD